VNGSRVAPKERRQLCHGDSIQISDHLVLFYHHGSFSDRKGLSTIVFDAGKVSDEVGEVMKELPEIKKRGSGKGS
jgi:pSer/pThr/pTyr-binding forkhead associated (FHA) protein